MDGLALAEKLRGFEPTRNTPVILLTAKGFELDHQQLIEQLKLTALLAKPFSPSELARLVANALSGITAPTA